MFLGRRGFKIDAIGTPCKLVLGVIPVVPEFRLPRGRLSFCKPLDDGAIILR